MNILASRPPSTRPSKSGVEVAEEIPLGKQTARSYAEMIRKYRKNIRRFGFKPLTLLYPSEEPYKDKLAQYCDVLNQLIKSGCISDGDSLLDIGCGYGNLLGCLKDMVGKTGHPAGPYRYLGIDMVGEFLEYAQKRYSSVDGRPLFEQTALEEYCEKADWCILLGVVNSVPDPKNLVLQAFERCRKGLIVDFNDSTKVKKARYTIFDVNTQKQRLNDEGAHVTVINESKHPWTILLATKE